MVARVMASRTMGNKTTTTMDSKVNTKAKAILSNPRAVTNSSSILLRHILPTTKAPHTSSLTGILNHLLTPNNRATAHPRLISPTMGTVRQRLATISGDLILPSKIMADSMAHLTITSTALNMARSMVLLMVPLMAPLMERLMERLMVDRDSNIRDSREALRASAG